jgi:phosphoribosylaminoimidazolecarboxamide formyltransferase/IMP cyclohydrolase
MESAYIIPREFDSVACAIIKHANPCGFGIGENITEAYLRAVSTDPISYFGGIVGFNKGIDEIVAEELVKPFLECIIAPFFSKGAKEILKQKKNLRLISVKEDYDEDLFSIKSVVGGYLYQQKDSCQRNLDALKIVSKRKPTDVEVIAMDLGWKLVRHVKSNAIVFANENQLISVGAGQMSRIDSVKIAIQKVADNGLNLYGSIMASDAFFPFPDCLELAAEVGITGVIQPGGSIKDDEVIKIANKLGIAMAMTGIRHFLH